MFTLTKNQMFKWNPFRMFGEAPSNFRFKDGDVDELEFATKEDLDAIMADPRLTKYYNAAKAGVTKKFQGWSGEKKQLADRITQLEASLQDWGSKLDEWETWANQNESALQAFITSQNDPESGGKKKGGGLVDDKGYEPRFVRMEQSLNQRYKQLAGEIGKIGRMLDLSLQLNELHRTHGTGLDEKKILDVFEKKAHRSLLDAYNDEDAYGKEILERKVEERTKTRLAEELQKEKTKVETGSPSFPMKFELPKTSSSMMEAGLDFLKDRAQGKEQTPPLTTEK